MSLPIREKADSSALFTKTQRTEAAARTALPQEERDASNFELQQMAAQLCRQLAENAEQRAALEFVTAMGAVTAAQQAPYTNHNGRPRFANSGMFAPERFAPERQASENSSMPTHGAPTI